MPADDYFLLLSVIEAESDAVEELREKAGK